MLTGNMAIYNEFGYITIDDARINATCNAYFKWKHLNNFYTSCLMKILQAWNGMRKKVKTNTRWMRDVTEA